MMKIINIAGKSYYAGLSWQTLSASDNVKEKIKELGNGYYCVRNLSGMINIGYSEDLDGKYKKLYSLASNVANAKKEPWLGVFHIEDDLYWLIAVRDNQAIIPDGDVIGTKEEIDKVFQETISIGEWDSIIENGEIEDLEALLTQGGSYVLSTSKKYNILLFIAIGVLAAVFILYFYHKRQIQQIKPKVFIPKVFAKKAAVKIQGYKTLPKPALILYKCKEELNSLPSSYYGWKASSLSCTANDISVVYKKQLFGTTLIAPKGNIGQNGLEVTKNISVNLSNPAHFRKLLSRRGAMKLIYGYMQEFNITGNVTNAGDKFMLNLNLNSLKILPVFFTIPTFRIESIKISELPLNERINVVAEAWYD
jgi:hypothetical protein